MEKDRFIRGKMPTAWQAKWITPERVTKPDVRQGAGYMRRRLMLDESVFHAGTEKAEALLYVTAHGLYEVLLNGEKITDALFTPGTDEYRLRLQVQCYDVTELLKAGENELFITLGDGWYRGNNGIDGTRNLFGEDLSLLLQLELNGNPVLASDTSFEASMDGPILLTDLELGEICDGRKEAREFYPARELSFSFDNLVPTETVRVSAHERFPGTLLHTPSGETVFDFGQNLAGFTSVVIRNAKAGQQLKLIHGETLDENGNFTIQNFQPGKRNQNGGIPQETVYICQEGENRYQPKFSFFGFRYAKLITEIPEEEISVTAVAVYSDMKETADFRCGDPLVEKLFQNSVWSMKSNFLDIPTDCPTRERAGWTGDAGVFVKTGTYLMDCVPVYRKWLQNLRLKQQPDGRLPFIVPENEKPGMITKLLSASVGWGDASVIVPYELYQKTGERQILEENYEMMKGWVRFLEKRARRSRLKEYFRKDPYRRYTITTGLDYGEWNEPGSDMMSVMKEAARKGQPEVGTAYLAYSSGLLTEIAELLGKTKDAASFKKLHENAVKAYRYRFLPDGRIHTRRQCEYVRPIAMGFLSEEEASQAAEDLAKNIRENGNRLNTGFLSTAWLLPVLSDHGRTKVAYDLLLQEECPGWLYAVRKGATTIWETWDGIREDGTVHDSLNHYSYGAVSGWLITGVLGIRYRFDSVTISPRPDRRLRFAEGSYCSPRGEIRSSWRYDEESERFTYEIELPEGMEAHVVLPDGREERVSGGKHRYA